MLLLICRNAFLNVYSFYLTDDGVIGGGDGVEDPFDALQWFLIAGGDAIKRFIVVLQGTTALTAPERERDPRISVNTTLVWVGNTEFTS